MTASAYKRPFAEPKGCIGERQQPAKSGRSDKRVFWELRGHHLMRDQVIEHASSFLRFVDLHQRKVSQYNVEGPYLRFSRSHHRKTLK